MVWATGTVSLGKHFRLSIYCVLFEKYCHHNQKQKLKELSLYLLKHLLEKLVLVDSVVVGKVVGQGEGKDQQDDHPHQNKNSRHCHTQKQPFLVSKNVKSLNDFW